MYYKIRENIALREWKYVSRAIYIKGIDHALRIDKDEFEMLLKCDGKNDLNQNDEIIQKLMQKGYIIPCNKGEEPNPWSKLIKYDNLYFPRMNLMITGKCNMNCLHCFNAKDNAPLNSEWKYEDILKLLDEAKAIGVHAFTLTGGEPLVHPNFLNIVKAIYERDMYVFELNTNGYLINQSLLDNFKAIGCYPLIKISFDGISYHNWMRNNQKAEDKTIEAIKLCIQNGFKVKVQTQVNNVNVASMEETAKMLDELGVSEMRIIRTTEVPRWTKNAPNASLNISDYYQKMLDFSLNYINSNCKMNIDIWQFMKLYPQKKEYYLTPIISNKNDFNIRLPLCKGNRGMIAVSSSGEVVPCLQMSGYLMEKGVSYANLHNNSLKEIITKSDYLDLAIAPLLKKILSNNKCAECEYFKACTGGCPALGLLSSGDKIDYYFSDETKCAFFFDGWYQKVIKIMHNWKLLNPLFIQ